ncbi:MAG: RNA methyltransferase [Thermodesulfobacteriota bacterium]|nr:RNA methyltransferase [Thermodesulfobacteriota bacterium]
MKKEVISSPQNPLFKELKRLSVDSGYMVLEGRRLVADALARGIEPMYAAVTPEYLLLHGPFEGPHYTLSQKLFLRLCDTKNPQGLLVIAEVPFVDISAIQGIERIVILDRLQDPGNVGTIIRTADAFGFGAVVITPSSAAPFSPKAIRASMGSCLGLKIVRAVPREVSSLPHRIITLDAHGESVMSGDLFRSPMAICLGQEASGVSPELTAISNCCVRIPMKGDTESLNVAVAAGIVMACAAGIFPLS